MAQVAPETEPMVATAAASMPTIAEPKALDTDSVIDAVSTADPLSPLPDTDEPQARPAADLADLVAQMRSGDPGSRELECLAVGVYFEAKSEPLAGQLAVGDVIANRANSGGRFPSSYCGVLFQRGQFSFVRGKSWPAVNRSSRQWHNAVAIAKIVDQDLKDSSVSNALFFHAKRVSPRWRLKRIASVGNHVFYR
ncbi:MAG TPA: cell wall hydrolase [Sphingomicrobium sp.]|nr:cell wall hydrolase [Sphingomicrobium sp.]